MTENSWMAAGLIFGPAPHYVDHLAPLCSVLGIPLIVTEEDEEKQIKSFYPEIKVSIVDPISLPDLLVKHIDIVFLCTPRILFDEIFFFAQKLHNKRVHTIWCPHGNSDKGHQSLFMEGLDKEEISLVYGQKMLDFLKKKKAFDQLKAHVITGNYRKAYYLKNKAFYDNLVFEKILKKLPPAEKTVFYAPTWEDSESSSSFYKALPFLVENLPSHWNLLIKPHPNLLLGNEEKFQKFIEKFEEKENVHFILNFPPIFPLLEASDIYIGDFSSIGYDFLGFNRPMFFLNQTKRDQKKDLGLFLYRCGVEIQPESFHEIYSRVEEEIPNDALHFGQIRKEIDEYTFGARKSEEKLKEEIAQLYKYFPDKDLNFY